MAVSPDCGASLLVASAVKERKHWITIVLPAIVIAASVAIGPQLLSEIGGLQGQLTYGGRYSSLHNLMSFESWRDVSTVFLFFAFVAPVPDFVTGTGRPDWHYIMSNWATMVAVSSIAGAYYLMLKHTITRHLGRALLGVGFWLGSLLIFFVVFNPREVMLYASLPATLVAYCCAVVIGHERGWRIADPSRRTIYTVLLAAAAVLLVCLNLPAILGW